MRAGRPMRSPARSRPASTASPAPKRASAPHGPAGSCGASNRPPASSTAAATTSGSAWRRAGRAPSTSASAGTTASTTGTAAAAGKRCGPRSGSRVLPRGCARCNKVTSPSRISQEDPMRKAVIVSAARTAIGTFGGALAQVPAPELGAVAIREALRRAGDLSGDQVDEVILGNVLTAGLGLNPARVAYLKAGLPIEVPGYTINKACGSGLKAVALAAQAIALGDADVVVAGGM